ncbi:unnamed protein product [Phytophthora fragariaefolia]|uniref:Unnamed protein product n=1 Tax=Phytophthora fragariaefolia TaxID=1490495 RepID=A0A9W6WTY9_9STRA|nr:unnamed protein product [Phytophthora fragariaefolia]
MVATNPPAEETSQRLVSVLETFASGGASCEELEYTAELLVAITEEDAVHDRPKLVAAFVEVLEETELLDAAQLPLAAEQLAAVFLGNDDDEEQESHASRRRRMRRERLETQFAIGKSCLVVLEEDDAWHPARITRHIGGKEDSDGEDEDEEDNDRPIEVEVEFIEFGKKQIAREDEVVLDEDVAGREDGEDMTGLCAMCERPMNLTAHHVIPRVTHSKYLRKGYTKEFLNTCIMICRQCHSKIHSVEDNKTLAREYNTLEKIMQHPKIIDWVAYARKQKARTKPRKKSKWPVGK